MDTKYFTKEELENILETYIKDKHDNLAVMLNGEWGSGKTYFINGFKQKLEKDKKYNNKYNIVYLSMYGITSLEDIKQKFLTAFFKKNIERLKPAKDDKKFSKWKYMTSTFLDFVGSDSFIKYSSFLLNNTKIEMPALGSIGICKGFLGNLKDWPDYENTILIIDDFERSSIDVVELLGYINSLVEHGKYKVIIVANEKEINSVFSNHNLEEKISALLSSNKNERYFTNEGIPNKKNIYADIKEHLNNNIMYQEIKEKTIGRTIKFNMNSEDVIRSIISTRGISEYMLNDKYIEEIEYIFSFLGCNIKNFRTIEFALNSYSYFVNKLAQIITDEDLLSREKEVLFKYVLAKAIMIKHPDVYEKFVKTLTNKMQVHLWGDGKLFVDEFMEQGWFGEHEFETIYKTKAKNYINTKNLSFYKINTDDIICLSEQEIIEICKLLYSEIDERKYPFAMYSSLVNRLFFIEKNMEIDIGIMSFIKLMYGHIESAGDEELVGVNFYIPEYEVDADELKILQNIKDKITTSNTNKIMKGLEKIISERNIDQLISYIRENKDNLASEKKCMAAFDDESLKYIIEKTNNEQIRDLAIAIFGVYYAYNIQNFLKEDLEALERFLTLLKEQIGKADLDKSRKYMLKDMVDTIERIRKGLI